MFRLHKKSEEMCVNGCKGEYEEIKWAVKCLYLLRKQTKGGEILQSTISLRTVGSRWFWVRPESHKWESKL